MKEVASTLPELHSVIQRLDGVAHPDITAALLRIQKKLQDASQGYLDAEEAQWEADMEKLDSLASENNFKTQWSMDVPADKLSDLMPYPIIVLRYEGQSIEVNKTLTWLELWKLCNMLILQSKWHNHIFIESLIDEGNGQYTLSTGS